MVTETLGFLAATPISAITARYWDFRSIGHGDIQFEDIIVALNDIGYSGPLSIEWEDGRMDRVHGATESCRNVKSYDFAPSRAAFDAAFERKKA